MPAHRLLFVESSVGGVVGGSLTGILPLIQRLDRRRWTPIVVLYEDKPVVPELRAAGVEVHILAPAPPLRGNGARHCLVRAWLRLRDLVCVVAPRARALTTLFRRERPHLVYLANGFTTNLAAVIAGARCGLPILVHEKGFHRLGPVARFMSRWVDTCIGMTDEIVEHVRVRGARPGRFLTVFDGISCDDFATGEGEAIRREFGIPLHAPVVGVVGHLQPWKGQMLVVEAMELLHARHPELRCLLVGGVHRAGHAYTEALRARIAAAKLERHVILTGARDDVAACLSAMDVAIHSSIQPEPFGRVLIEAMALGRPLVAPREGGPRVIVADGETGLLVPPRDARALADAIDELIGDPARRRDMGRAARARVEAVFDIRHHVRALQTVFAEMLGEPALPEPVVPPATAPDYVAATVPQLPTAEQGYAAMVS
jgi:glycosyltransferase involved in cell wall biosynthesis